MLKSEPKDEQDGANVRNKGGKDPRPSRQQSMSKAAFIFKTKLAKNLH